MYFGVLQTQKAVLQEDAINCRRELVKVQKALDQERELSQYFRRCLTNANGSTSSGRARSDESLDVTKPDNVSVRSADDDSPVNHSSPSLLGRRGFFLLGSKGEILHEKGSFTHGIKEAFYRHLINCFCTSGILSRVWTKNVLCTLAKSAAIEWTLFHFRF